MNRDHSVVFEIVSKYWNLDFFVDYKGYSISYKAFFPHSSRCKGHELNSSIPVHFSSLIPKMSMFTLDISCLITSNLPWFKDLTCSCENLTGSYAISLFTALHFTSIICYIHTWLLVLLWLCLFILSGVMSPLISSNILGTYWSGEFIFQCHIFLTFHTVHGVLKARTLKWFAIAFSSRPHFVRTLHHDSSILADPTCHAS